MGILYLLNKFNSLLLNLPSNPLPFKNSINSLVVLMCYDISSAVTVF